MKDCQIAKKATFSYCQVKWQVAISFPSSNRLSRQKVV